MKNLNIEYPHPESNPVVKKNPSFDEKLSQIHVKDLIIVSDFDYTFTRRFHINEKTKEREQLLCGFTFYNECPEIPIEIRKQIKKLWDDLSKFEDDLTVEYKIRDEKTKERFEKNIELISSLHLKKDFISKNLEKILNVVPFYYRYGTKKYFEILKEQNINLILISGGIKEPIEDTLQILYNDINMKNIHIITNEFNYDENNCVIDYKKPLVYTFNKCEIVDKRIKEIFSEEELKNKYILFTGDHINDIDAIKDIKCKLKLGIGFDNNVEEGKNLNDEYLKKYDAVICNEGDFNFLNDVLEKIIKNN